MNLSADALTVPLSDETNIELLTQIVADERQILSDVFNTLDVTTIPQIWTLCESVKRAREAWADDI